MTGKGYGVVRTDNMKATKDGSIKSGRFYASGVEAPIENGNIVKLDVLVNGERELYKAVEPGTVTASNLYLVATPEIIYDETLSSTGALENFRNEAGENITLLQGQVGDEFSVSDDCIIKGAGDPAVGDFVVPSAAGTKWTAVVSISNSEVFYGKVVDRELYRQGKYLNVIRLISVV